MPLRIKYCGGCNPEFDRVKLAEDIARRYREAVGEGGPELLLRVSGCARSCAAAEGEDSFHIYRPADADEVLGRLIERAAQEESTEKR